MNDFDVAAQSLLNTLEACKPIPESDWKWFGQAGHYCEGHRCRWHLHTHIASVCISSVGELFRPGSDEMYPIGGANPDGSPGRFYETMVFDLTPDQQVENLSPSFSTGHSSREAAEEGHMVFCHCMALYGFQKIDDSIASRGRILIADLLKKPAPGQSCAIP